MEMRIVVRDGLTSRALAERLRAVFGTERIALDDNRREVNVRVAGTSDSAVLRVLDTVERWLEQVGVGSAEMWLGEHSYRIARRPPVQVWPRNDGPRNPRSPRLKETEITDINSSGRSMVCLDQSRNAGRSSERS